MVDSFTVVLRFALGLALVANPLYAPALSLTGTTYTYERVPVVVDGEGLSVDADPREVRLYEGVDGIGCFHDTLLPPRWCLFEAALLTENLTADYPLYRAYSGDPKHLFETRPAFVAFGDGEPVYRRTYVPGSDGTFTLALEPVDPEVALEAVARSSEYVSDAARRVVETGRARTSHELPEENAIVEHDGRYYVVYRAESDSFLSRKPLTERLFSAAGVLLGVLALLSAQRARVEDRLIREGAP